MTFGTSDTRDGVPRYAHTGGVAMIQDPFVLGLSNAVLTEDGLVERAGDSRTLLTRAIDHLVRQPGEEEDDLAPRSSQVAFWIPGPISWRW